MPADDLMLDEEVQRLFADTSLEIYPALAPVSEWPIMAWCRALQDDNPVYRDAEAGHRLGHGGRIAPPIMMHSFTMPGVFSVQTDGLLAQLRRALAKHGLNSVLAANYEQEFVTPIRLGDRLTRTMRLASIGDEKVTGAGIGRFVVMQEAITNDRGETIGHQSLRIFFFRPTKPDERPAGQKPQQATAAEGKVEDRIILPPVSIPLSTTLIVAAALASNDYEAIHHDREAAQAQGLRDVIMNVLASTGLAMRYVTDWAGPIAKVRRIATRLKAPNYPGDTMILSGSADSPYRAGRPLDVHVRGSNSLGTHIDSIVTVE